MSTSAHKLRFITPAEYLEGEDLADLRHEYFDGHIQAMSGASDRHNEIALDVASFIKSRLKDGPCKTFLLDMKLELRNDGKTYYYYPDVFVTCSPEDAQSPLIKRHPVLVIEVLSPSTWRVDQGEKLQNYKLLSGLFEIVFIAQEWPEVILHRRSNQWQPEHFSLPDDNLHLESIGLNLTLAEIYKSIEFRANEERPWYLRNSPSDENP
jgi:Uma2 family endonuclease